MTATARAERLIIEDPEPATLSQLTDQWRDLQTRTDETVAEVLALLRLLPPEARQMIVEGLGGVSESTKDAALQIIDKVMVSIAIAGDQLERAEALLERGSAYGAGRTA